MWGNNFFCKMVKNPKDHRLKLSLLCKAVLASAEGTTGEDDAMDALPSLLQEASKDLQKICGGLAFLLCPADTLPGTSTSRAAAEMMKYKGKQRTFVYLQKYLSGSDYWQSIWSEVITKGAVSVKVKPEVDKLIKMLSESDAAAIQKQLPDLVKQFTAWKEQVRTGLLSELEPKLAEVLRSYGNELLQTQASNSTASFLESVLSGLKAMKSDANTLQLCQKLQKLRESQAKQLAVRELKEILAALPNAMPASIAELPPIPDPQDLVQQLTALSGTTLDLQAAESVFIAVFWMFLVAFTKRGAAWLLPYSKTRPAKHV